MTTRTVTDIAVAWYERLIVVLLDLRPNGLTQAEIRDALKGYDHFIGGTKKNGKRIFEEALNNCFDSGAVVGIKVKVTEHYTVAEGNGRRFLQREVPTPFARLILDKYMPSDDQLEKEK